MGKALAASINAGVCPPELVGTTLHFLAAPEPPMIVGVGRHVILLSGEEVPVECLDEGELVSSLRSRVYAALGVLPVSRLKLLCGTLQLEDSVEVRPGDDSTAVTLIVEPLADNSSA